MEWSYDYEYVRKWGMGMEIYEYPWDFPFEGDFPIE
jgi:hypothetical protein